MVLDMARDAVDPPDVGYGDTFSTDYVRWYLHTYRVLHSPIMGVTHVVAPSNAHKKTRRSLAKRRAVVNGNSEASSMKQNNTDEDEDMQLEPLIEGSTQSNKNAQEDDELAIDVDTESAPQPSSAPSFPALPAAAAQSITLKSETRRIPIPPHRMTPIKKDWVNIFSPLTEILGLQVRMNVQRRCVEIRVCIRRSSGSIPHTVSRRRGTPKTLGRFKKELISSKPMHWVLMSM